MPKDYSRSRRIAEQIQRELAGLVRLELKDPRVAGLLTITDVEVSADQSHAKVFFTLLGDETRVKETTIGLTRAAGFLRTQLAQRMKLRTVPTLEFKYDASIERGMKLSRLIDEAVGAAPKPKADE
ncbi:MAG TPA: 30S ribosome-binding factor RbfA [Burkholderiales bacterium]|nr:30S ribosome-binding factor RbfA [Burkholderiales bacterium]